MQIPLRQRHLSATFRILRIRYRGPMVNEPPNGSHSPDPVGQRFRIGPIPLDPSIWIYTTVSLMALLVVYDGWSELEGVGGIVLVVVGPTLALAVAHVFADFVGHVIHGSRPTDALLLRDLAFNFWQYLMVAGAALATLFVSSVILLQPPSESIRFMLVGATVSLTAWGGIAGWRGGYRGVWLVAAALFGLLVGFLVFGFQILLKPH